ncbi:MAG: hypothetical protein AVDCRST_MAG05-1359, partial [uncultured Rubrobacteraceae bacterium]
ARHQHATVRREVQGGRQKRAGHLGIGETAPHRRTLRSHPTPFAQRSASLVLGSASTLLLPKTNSHTSPGKI